MGTAGASEPTTKEREVNLAKQHQKDARFEDEARVVAKGKARSSA